MGGIIVVELPLSSVGEIIPGLLVGYHAELGERGKEGNVSVAVTRGEVRGPAVLHSVRIEGLAYSGADRRRVAPRYRVQFQGVFSQDRIGGFDQAERMRHLGWARGVRPIGFDADGCSSEVVVVLRGICNVFVRILGEVDHWGGHLRLSVMKK